MGSWTYELYSVLNNVPSFTAYNPHPHIIRTPNIALYREEKGLIPVYYLQPRSRETFQKIAHRREPLATVFNSQLRSSRIILFHTGNTLHEIHGWQYDKTIFLIISGYLENFLMGLYLHIMRTLKCEKLKRASKCGIYAVKYGIMCHYTQSINSIYRQSLVLYDETYTSMLLVFWV